MRRLALIVLGLTSGLAGAALHGCDGGDDMFCEKYAPRQPGGEFRESTSDGGASEAHQLTLSNDRTTATQTVNRNGHRYVIQYQVTSTVFR